MWFLEGNLAGALSAAVLLWRGRVQARRRFGALNAPSHWVWGDKALRRDGPSLRYTVLGLVIHQASSLFWAAAYRTLLQRAGPPSAGRVALGAAAVGAAAAVVDLRLVPHRLTPGFQHHLSAPSLGLVYASFAAGLLLATALGTPAARQRAWRLQPASHQPLKERRA